MQQFWPSVKSERNVAINVSARGSVGNSSSRKQCCGVEHLRIRSPGAPHTSIIQYRMTGEVIWWRLCFSHWTWHANRSVEEKGVRQHGV
jgi:hypothetical protein